MEQKLVESWTRRKSHVRFGGGRLEKQVVLLAGRLPYKTVAASAVARRMLEQGIQVIMLEPQGHSRRLVSLAG